MYMFGLKPISSETARIHIHAAAYKHAYSELLDGELGGAVRPSECLWTLEVLFFLFF